jgi:hypothetical protein
MKDVTPTEPFSALAIKGFLLNLALAIQGFLLNLRRQYAQRPQQVNAMGPGHRDALRK